MKKKELTRGRTTIVDDDIYEQIKDQRWQCDNYGYAKRGISKKPSIYLHRVIANCPTGMEVDHINGDRLDNRRENLRIVTSAQNKYNRIPSKGRYKGIFWHPRDKRWYARITYKKQDIYLGSYKESKDAAKAYNEGAKKYFGIYARPNDV